MAKQIQLAIDPDIAPTWGLWEAFREVLQGAVDADAPYTLQYSAEEKKITISISGYLSKASLLIGHSTKRGDKNKIGQHGEGYKLAAAVLLRLEKPFSVYNNKEIWSFGIRYNRTFGVNTINLTSASWFVPETGTIKWEIGNIEPEEWVDLRAKVVDGGDIVTENCSVLLDRPGQIFCGGLFVCEIKDLTYGYNFNPGVLTLRRDRNLVSEFDIFWETSRAWASHPNVLILLHEGAIDVKYIQNQVPSNLSDKAFMLFTKTYGAKANPCSCEAHKLPGANNVIVSESYRKVIIGSTFFGSSNFIDFSTATPHELLYNWYMRVKEEEHYTNKDFERLIEKAKRRYVKN